MTTDNDDDTDLDKPLFCVILWENGTGLSIFGPFSDQEEAEKWTEKDIPGDYLIVPLSDPTWPREEEETNGTVQ